MAHREAHRVDRIGWLRAAVLGANDGLVSTASLVVGVAAAATSHGVARDDFMGDDMGSGNCISATYGSAFRDLSDSDRKRHGSGDPLALQNRVHPPNRVERLLDRECERPGIFGRSEKQ